MQKHEQKNQKDKINRIDIFSSEKTIYSESFD